jgi:hypothetical protein
MEGQGAARPATPPEKTEGRAAREIAGLASNLRGRLPFAEARLGRAIKRSLETRRPDGPWFAVASAFAEAVLGERLVIDVDPASISRWLLSQAALGPKTFHPRESFIGGGDWSALTAPLAGSGLDREARAIFAGEGALRETTQFQDLMARVLSAPVFHNGHWLRNRADIETYFAHHVALLESIRSRGVLRHGAIKSTRAWRIERKETDAGVAIGAGGELLRYRGGFHRTAFAQMLRLKSMPVAVRLVHGDWLRARMRETGLDPLRALLAGLDRMSVK